MDDMHNREIAVFIISLLQAHYITPETVSSFLSEERHTIEDAHRLDVVFIDSFKVASASSAARKLAYDYHNSDVTWDDLEYAANQILDFVASKGMFVLHPFMSSYPQRLLRCETYPPILYCKGDVSAINHEKTVAIVGTSSPTDFGSKMGRRFARLLADDGYVIVSNLDDGCASDAHEGVLDAGGRSIAMIGGPISKTMQDDELANRIIDAGGIIVSEHAPSFIMSQRSVWGPFDRHRDWIAALADGVAAVEMSFNDGSWRVMEHAIKADAPVAAFDYRRSQELCPRFETERRFSGNMHYLARRRGVFPIWDAETVENFMSQMDAYRLNSEHPNSEKDLSTSNDCLRAAALRLVGKLSDESSDVESSQIDLNEESRDLAYRLAHMMHGEDLARKRRSSMPTRDSAKLRHGKSGTCTWAIDADGILFIYPTDGVSGTLERKRAMFVPLSGWPWLVDDTEWIRAAIIGDGVVAPDCRWFFSGCEKLIYADLTNLKVMSTSGFDSMFTRCYRLKSYDLPTGIPQSAIRSMPAARKKAPVPITDDASVIDNDVQGTCGTCSWAIDTNGQLVVWPTDGTCGVLELRRPYSMYTWPWRAHRDKIKAVTFEEGVVAPEGISSLLSQCKNLQSADLSNLDTSHVTNMRMMFYECPSLEVVNLSGLDTSSVSDVREMFQNCPFLASVDISGWDMSSVTDMDRMFYGCKSLANLDISDWNPVGVKSMRSMFYGCSSLETLDLSGWETPALKQMVGETGSLKIAEGLFAECTSLKALNLSGWNTSAVTDMRSMFANCSSLVSLNVSDWDTSSVIDMRDMFRDCSSLASLDISCWDTHAVTNMGRMFQGCSALETLEISDWNVSSLTDMWDTFHGCYSLISLDLSSWNTAALQIIREVFRDCFSLKSIEVADWDTSNITNMGGAFEGCSSLVSLDLSRWDTSRVRIMKHIFHGCSSLTLIDLSRWKTSGVTDLCEAFRGCTSLHTLDLSGWNTSHVQNMAGMFCRCTSLSVISVGPLFDVSKAFPNATNKEAKWLSMSDGRWYTVEKIASERTGIADTYASQPRV